MNGFLHKIWVVLFAFMIFGLLAWVPVDKYQKAYMDEYHRFKAMPQKRIDASYKYVEYIENGGYPEVAKSFFDEPRMKPRKRFHRYNPRHRKPYFIRDKYNPNVLHPYRG